MRLRACARVLRAATQPWRCLSPSVATSPPGSARAAHVHAHSAGALAPFARSLPAGYRLSRGVPGSRVPPHARTAVVARAASSSSASSDGLRGSLSARAADAIVSSSRDDDSAEEDSSRDEIGSGAPDEVADADARHPWYARLFWTEQVTGPAVKQSARLMAKRLDFDDPLGVDLTLRGASSSNLRDGPRKSGRRRATLYDYALDVKRTHPTKVLLIRVGEFYEALGYDAVLLVMHAGLNPMGTAGVPRAGCPLVKVQETLDRLTHRGFAVVVCEEVPSMNPYGQRAPPKERYVAAVITPASPQYVVGAADAGDDVAFDGDAPPPVVAAAATATGYTLISVDPDLRRAVVLEGMTAESAAAKLAASGHAPPLYRHASLDAGFGARGGAAAGVSGPTRRLRMEIGNILSAARDARGDGGELGGSAAHQRYDAKDPLKGVLEMVRREYNMPPDAAFEIVKAGGGPGSNAGASAGPSSGSKRPYPLSLATAQQLGVLPTRSVPPLLSHVLPASLGAPAACRAYVQELLLHPPPLDTARAISGACAALTSLTPADGAVPRLEVTPPAKIAKLLRTREGSHMFFAELSAMARAARLMLEHDSEKARAAGESLLNPTSLKVGRPVDRVGLVAACASAEAIVAGVVAAEVLESPFMEDAPGGASSRIAGSGGGEGGAEASDATSASLEGDEYADGDAEDDWDDFAADAPPRVLHLPSRFLRLNEPWRGRVRREVVAEAVDRVEAAARELSAAIDADLAPLTRLDEVDSNSRRRRRACFLEHDQRNNALWLRHLSAAEARTAIDAGVPLLHPVDRWGKEISDRWSTERVERAADGYRVAANRAGGAVSSALRRLAKALDDHVPDLIAAATFSAIATAVSLHAKHALARGWRPATLLDEDDVTTPFQATRLTPFWMSRTSDGAVPNDVQVSGLVLLTGPNMAGKSTVLRTTAASALLAACGLFVPADAAVVPHFDSLAVRMSSTDSPAEGLSSYAVEMAEVSAMLDVVTPRSLVFIDELGRGTEAAHGTAMGGAVVEALDAAGARGMFATHLHGVLDLPLRVSPFVTRAKMETVLETIPGEEGASRERLAPTWRVVPGECRESLALQTATDMGVRADVVARGEALLGDVLANERSRYRRPAGASGEPGADPLDGASAEGFFDDEASDANGVSERAGASSASRRASRARLVSVETLRSALAEEFESLLASSRASEGLDPPDAEGTRETRVGYVGFDETPSAASGAWTCVYVLRHSDGWVYCGETDDLARRLETHRATARRENDGDDKKRRGGGGSKIECVFVTVPKTSGGKSAARRLESRVIRRLARLDAPLLSGRDARNVSFGSGMAG